jgi:hypothetical protein
MKPELDAESPEGRDRGPEGRRGSSCPQKRVSDLEKCAVLSTFSCDHRVTKRQKRVFDLGECRVQRISNAPQPGRAIG